jgi:hypothetical protein
MSSVLAGKLGVLGEILAGQSMIVGIRSPPSEKSFLKPRK